MKRRTLLDAALATLLPAAGLGWFLRLRQTKDTLLGVKTVRQTKEFAFFRVEGAETDESMSIKSSELPENKSNSPLIGRGQEARSDRCQAFGHPPQRCRWAIETIRTKPGYHSGLSHRQTLQLGKYESLCSWSPPITSSGSRHG